MLVHRSSAVAATVVLIVAALIGISVAALARAEVTESPSYLLSAQQLKDLSRSGKIRKFALVDDATGLPGELITGNRSIEVSWFFKGTASVAILSARDGAWICMVMEDQQTQCLSFSIGSGACQYVVRTRKGGKSACLREVFGGTD